MAKYVYVNCDWPRDTGGTEAYIKVDDDASDELCKEVAEVYFSNWANYGYTVVESVPEDAEHNGVDVVE